MLTRRTTLAAIAAAALLGAGCGAQTSGDPATTQPTSSVTTKNKPSTTSAAKTTAIALSQRSPSQLIIDGFSAGSLSRRANTEYRKQGGAENVTIETDNTSTAFTDLCNGHVDIVDSSTPISKAETKACIAAGIQPVQIQVASDAVVLATENETDVGADCLTLPQVKTIFKAGSPVHNWNQLGFDDVRLQVAGPNPKNPGFTFFGQYLVGERLPSQVDFRYNYHGKSTEDGIRAFVVGTEKKGELASSHLLFDKAQVLYASAYIKGQLATLKGALKFVKQSRHFHKPIALAKARAKRDRAEHRLKVYRKQLAASQKVLKRDELIQQQAQRTLGHLGVFHYDYYTLYEQQLRPLEITAKASPENCVFPSQATITSGSYPLSRRLLLTFSLQELRQNEALRSFLLSYLKNANQLATTLEMVPLPPNILEQEIAWLKGTDDTSNPNPTATTPSNDTGEENSMSGTSGGVTEPTGEKTTTPQTTTTTHSTTTPSGEIPQGVH